MRAMHGSVRPQSVPHQLKGVSLAHVQVHAGACARLCRPQARLLIAVLHNCHGALAVDGSQPVRRRAVARAPVVVGPARASRLLRRHLRMAEQLLLHFLDDCWLLAASKPACKLWQASLADCCVFRPVWPVWDTV